MNITIPWDTIHIRIVSLNINAWFLPFPCIPYSYRFINWTRGKYVGFCWTPLRDIITTVVPAPPLWKPATLIRVAAASPLTVVGAKWPACGPTSPLLCRWQHTVHRWAVVEGVPGAVEQRRSRATPYVPAPRGGVRSRRPQGWRR
jgi:hypothetical protein